MCSKNLISAILQVLSCKNTHQQAEQSQQQNLIRADTVTFTADHTKDTTEETTKKDITKKEEDYRTKNRTIKWENVPVLTTKTTKRDFQALCGEKETSTTSSPDILVNNTSKNTVCLLI